jgi:hypothetical protein
MALHQAAFLCNNHFDAQIGHPADAPLSFPFVHPIAETLYPSSAYVTADQGAMFAPNGFVSFGNQAPEAAASSAAAAAPIPQRGVPRSPEMSGLSETLSELVMNY